jgi:hypothetical protein
MKERMSSKELRVLVTTISSSLIFIVYGLIVYFKKVEGNFDILNDTVFWGKTFLIFIPIAIVTLIIIHIILAIVNKIVTDEDMPSKSDEMDKLIELRSLRVSHWSFTGGFILALASQAVGMELWVMFVVLLGSGFLGSIAEGLTQLYYYRRGI